jgi:hypothetical protein
MENGFVAQEKCFVARAGRNIDEKRSMISNDLTLRERIRISSTGRSAEPLFGLPTYDPDQFLHFLRGMNRSSARPTQFNS